MVFASQRSFPLSEGRWLHDIRVIGFANSSAPVSHLELQLLQHRGELHRYQAIVDSCLIVAIVRILTKGAAVSSVKDKQQQQVALLIQAAKAPLRLGAGSPPQKSARCFQAPL